MKIPILLFFDDGYREDLIVAKMLAHRNLKATFSIPLRTLMGQIDEDDILKLASVGEIASHGISHQNMVKLMKINVSLAYHELYYSRRYLERLIGRPVVTFVYPFGIYNAALKELVRKCGYYCARTTEIFNTSSKIMDAYSIPVTLCDYKPDVYKFIRASFLANVRTSLSLWLLKHNIVRVNNIYNDYGNYLAFCAEFIKRVLLCTQQKESRYAILLVFHSNRIFKQKSFVKIFEKILDLIDSAHVLETLTMQDYMKRVVKTCA